MHPLGLQVTFLYQLVNGACPKSYGTACARLAGMPDAILDRAEALAAKLEQRTTRARSGNQAADMEDSAQPSTCHAAAWLSAADVQSWARSITEKLGDSSMEAPLKDLQAEAKGLLKANGAQQIHCQA